MFPPIVLSLLMGGARAADGLEVTLTFGKDQARAPTAPGVESFMRMGVDPVTRSGEWTLRASIPEQWADDSIARRAPSVPEYLPKVDQEVVALAKLVTDAGWAPLGDDLATARRVVALLHVATPNDEAPLGPDYGIWHPWELIANPERADTFSAALASMLVLERLNVPVHLAIYPWTGGDAYGVVVSGTPAAATPGVVTASAGRALVSCHRNAPPAAPPFAEWSHAEITASGWTPHVSAEARRPPPPRSPGLTVPAAGGEDESRWIALAAGVVVTVGTLGLITAVGARRRRLRVEARKASARKDSYS